MCSSWTMTSRKENEMNGKIGVYIHIPFCVRKCNYCDFLSFPADDKCRERYVDCLVKEIREFHMEQVPAHAEADTVFVGGGTPSLLSAEQMERIFCALRERIKISEQAEITIECNPGTATYDKLCAYRRMGINRISFGVQSAVSEELESLGRIHTFSEAASSFRQAREAGFENINIDLMSAIPGQTLSSYRYTLEQILALSPEHVSAYSLIVEEGTPFYEKYHDQPPVDEETDRDMYALTKEILFRYGYERYEISNYAKNGYECRHNLKYWSGEDYIGFGIGASSRIKNIHYKNESDILKYMEKIEAGKPAVYVEERMDDEAEMSEFILLGLRKIKGISREEFRSRFSLDIMERYGEVIKKFAEQGLLIVQGDRIAFTDRGLDISNYVLCEFLC